MTYETLDLQREGPVLWCTLNRPEALNALSPTLVDEYRDLLRSLETDRETRVVVLRGAGRAFCAGLDLKASGAEGAARSEPKASEGRAPGQDGAGGEGADGGVPAGLRGQRHISEIALFMRRLPQVFVACVHGPACGGGFMLALASDLRIAGASARMNAAFIKLGLSGCDVGVSYLLPRLVGASVAAELILTGRFLDAERARALGLVSTVVPDAELEAEARGLVADLLRTSPLGLRLSKECLNASLDAGSMEQVVGMEDRNQILCAQSRDFREGIRAFLEKREPRFRDA